MMIYFPDVETSGLFINVSVDASEFNGRTTAVIRDFTHGEDKIDLSLFNTGKEGDKLHFVDSVTGGMGEIRINYSQQQHTNDVAINLARDYDRERNRWISRRTDNPTDRSSIHC